MKNLTQTTVSRPYFDLVINHRNNNADDTAVIQEMFTENVYRLEGYKIPDKAIVLDIGANIGTFTLLALKLAQENNTSVTVYAVEPEKNNLELLRRNLTDNPLLFENNSEVIIIESGISDFVGKSGITNSSGGSRLSGGASLQQIDITTYDRLIERYEIDKIDFTKIDIEGSEVPLITGASAGNILKSHYYAIECDRMNDSEGFVNILRPFLNDFSVETWGIPANGCNLYLENHHWNDGS